ARYSQRTSPVRGRREARREQCRRSGTGVGAAGGCPPGPVRLSRKDQARLRAARHSPPVSAADGASAEWDRPAAVARGPGARVTTERSDHAGPGLVSHSKSPRPRRSTTGNRPHGSRSAHVTEPPENALNTTHGNRPFSAHDLIYDYAQ